jgi:hypothetical protein
VRGTVLQFDHRNSSLRQWLVEDYFGGPDCLGNPNIDGLILDDDWTSTGPTEENSFAAADMGLSARDLAEIGGNWSLSLQQLNDRLATHQQYVIPGYAGDSMSTRSHNHTQCAERMRQLGCAPHAPQTGPMVFTVRFNKNASATDGRYLQAIDAELDVVYYLLGRGPVAWIGSGYILGWALSLQWNVLANRPMTIDDFRVELFERDYGEPLGSCEETADGSEVFVRHWSKATATLDCRAFAGNITMVASDDGRD